MVSSIPLFTYIFHAFICICLLKWRWPSDLSIQIQALCVSYPKHSASAPPVSSLSPPSPSLHFIFSLYKRQPRLASEATGFTCFSGFDSSCGSSFSSAWHLGCLFKRQCAGNGLEKRKPGVLPSPFSWRDQQPTRQAYCSSHHTLWTTSLTKPHWIADLTSICFDLEKCSFDPDSIIFLRLSPAPCLSPSLPMYIFCMTFLLPLHVIWAPCSLIPLFFKMYMKGLTF